MHTQYVSSETQKSEIYFHETYTKQQAVNNNVANVNVEAKSETYQ